MNSREKQIDIMKVWACIFVLVFHVINGIWKDGNLSNEYLYYFRNFLNLFHVPVFFFCSGYLFSKKEINLKQNYLHFLKGKFINLGIPYVIFSIMYIVLSQGLSSNMHTSYGIQQIVSLAWKPVAQYWYLLTLLQIFILIPLCLYFIRNYKSMGIVFVIGYFLSYYLGVEIGFLKYAAIFALGCIYNVNKVELKKGNPSIPVVNAIGVYIAYIFLYRQYANRDFFLFVELGITLVMINLMYWYGCLVAMKDKVGSKFVNILRPYTFHIYILHTWITGPIRIILTKFSVDEYLQILVGVILGGGLSFVAAYIIKKIWTFNIFFEPTSTWRLLKNERKQDKR